MEYMKGKSLKKLLEKSNYKLSPDMSLFRLWIREIFLAFKDIL
jgi:hypothetical protein